MIVIIFTEISQQTSSQTPNIMCHGTKQNFYLCFERSKILCFPQYSLLLGQKTNRCIMVSSLSWHKRHTEFSDCFILKSWSQLSCRLFYIGTNTENCPLNCRNLFYKYFFQVNVSRISFPFFLKIVPLDVRWQDYIVKILCSFL